MDKHYIVDEKTLNLILNYIGKKPLEEVIHVFTEIKKNVKLYQPVQANGEMNEGKQVNTTN
jgi:hypothetical protein